MIDPETKRKRIETGVKVAALLGVCAILAPFTYAILGGLGALIVCLAAVNLAPWFGHKLANWRLKALKAEAAANPIETLENQFKARDEALRKTRITQDRDYSEDIPSGAFVVPNVNVTPRQEVP